MKPHRILLIHAAAALLTAACSAGEPPAQREPDAVSEPTAAAEDPVSRRVDVVRTRAAEADSLVRQREQQVRELSGSQ